jgi:excisionase family DNA binding protein
VDIMPDAAKLPALRATIGEAAEALRISRALLYQRIASGDIRAQKDGKRSFIAIDELNRYVATRERQ